MDNTIRDELLTKVREDLAVWFEEGHEADDWWEFYDDLASTAVEKELGEMPDEDDETWQAWDSLRKQYLNTAFRLAVDEEKKHEGTGLGIYGDAFKAWECGDLGHEWDSKDFFVNACSRHWFWYGISDGQTRACSRVVDACKAWLANDPKGRKWEEDVMGMGLSDGEGQ